MSSTERLASLPNVPTAKEPGVDYQMSIWAGIFAPKGTPQAIVEKLAAALDKALDDPGCRSGSPTLAARSRPRTSARREIRRLREGRDRALVADPQGRGGAFEVAARLPVFIVPFS